MSAQRLRRWPNIKPTLNIGTIADVRWDITPSAADIIRAEKTEREKYSIRLSFSL